MDPTALVRFALSDIVKKVEAIASLGGQIPHMREEYDPPWDLKLKAEVHVTDTLIFVLESWLSEREERIRALMGEDRTDEWVLSEYNTLMGNAEACLQKGASHEEKLAFLSGDRATEHSKYIVREMKIRGIEVK